VDVALARGLTKERSLLNGLSVVEHAGSVAATIAGGLLADLGATVRFLEPLGGSELRSQPGFAVWGRAKQAVECADPIAEVVRASPEADVIIVDAEPWLRAREPKANRVTLVIDTFGGPSMYGSPGIGAAAAMGEAYSGLSWLQQGSREGPYFLLESPASFGSGALGVIGVLASLVSDVGRGETCRVSHLAGALALQLFAAVTAEDAPAEHGFADGDSRRIGGPMNRLHRASDGWVNVAISTRERFERACVALGLEDLLADDRYDQAPHIPDKDARTEVVARIAERIATMTVADVVRVMRGIDVIVGPVSKPGDALNHPQVAAMGLRYEAEDETGRKLVMPGEPIYGARDAELAAGHPMSPAGSLQAWRPAERSADSARAPLEGLRVLELATYAAGPGAARLLAGLGATVLKIEAPNGDPLRRQKYYFVGANENKISTKVNLKDSSGAETLEYLLKRSHVVINNYRPDIASRLGLAPHTIAAMSPGAVQCAILGYGSTGPLSNQPAFDIVFECLTGGVLIQGGGTEPVGYGGGIADNATSLMGATAVLAGLYSRMSSPSEQGPAVEVSLMSTVLYRHAGVFVQGRSDWRALPGLQPDPDHLTGSVGLFTAAGGEWLCLGVTNEMEWARLSAIIPDLPSAFLAGRDRDWDNRVRQLLQSCFGGLPFTQCESLLRGAEVPYCPAISFKAFATNGRRTEDRWVSRFKAVTGEREYIGIQDLIDFDAHSWVPTAELAEVGASDIGAVFA
jgi:crotonobetainyl-CoA:carnitine CoA-transferase CaiB-like acyl-CoA transferase